MFGDAPWPCGPASTANTDDGTEVGVTTDSVSIASGDDAGYAGSPGLSHETTDAMKALVAKCNELGGIHGRQIKMNYYDAALFNVGPAIQGACDDKNFFLVGDAWAFDSNQEETRLACGLPAVPTYSVSAAFAMGKDVFQGTPNPADEITSGWFAMIASQFPSAVTNVGVLTAAFASTQESRDKVIEAAPAFGWKFSPANVEYNPVGEADWTPFVKQFQDAGVTAVSWNGTCLPSLQLFAQSAKANGLDVPIFAETNNYASECAAANSDGAMDNVYVRSAFIPFEEAATHKATKDYIDLVTASGGDTALLGAQATTSFLLWATAASACGDTLTRECTLTNLKDTHKWTGHGLHAETDPGGNHPPSCNLLLKLDGTKYVRVAPSEPGSFDCDPTWITPITSTTALVAAKLDENRISQQFAS
jgi:ABC-type branched-subunit amino acid transport system substrate-binding protein